MDTSPLVLCKVGTLEVERYKTYLIYCEAKGTSHLLLGHYPNHGGQLSKCCSVKPSLLKSGALANALTGVCVSAEHRQGQGGEEQEEEEIFCTGGLQQIPLMKGSTKSGNQTP